MKKTIILQVLLFSTLLLNAQYISKVLEYKPAPGQLINEVPHGIPSAAKSIVGGVNGLLSLGAFGGYVVFEFSNPVDNHPDNPYGVDFTIFGNASAFGSEPAIVSVMKDENGNGLADDTWYELAGSNYFFSSTQKEYQVTYTNPNKTVAANVPWIDNLGGSGIVSANSFHTQAYYPLNDSFPDINTLNYTLSGTKIKEDIDRSTPTMVKSYPQAFGYADNHVRGTAPYTTPDNPYTIAVENSGGDAFDISWAVDAYGDYIDLDTIHFVKVQNAIQADMGWLGEVSTEIAGAVDISPNASISGIDEALVIDLPDTIRGTQYQLESAVFRAARLQAGEAINWNLSLPTASVGVGNLLSFTSSGTLTVTASLASNSAITTSASAVLLLDLSPVYEMNRFRYKLYPNPASDYISIPALKNATVSIYTSYGCLCLQKQDYNGESLSISNLSSGVYLVLVNMQDSLSNMRFIKK